MAPHATFAELLAAVGDERLKGFSSTSTVGSVQALWTGRLIAASGAVNATLRRAGYAVPVDYASLSADDAAEVAAILREATIARAVEMGALGIATEPGSPSRVFKETRDLLDDILRGRVRLPLPIVRKSVTSIPGPDNQKVASGPPLANELFEVNRTVL